MIWKIGTVTIRFLKYFLMFPEMKGSTIPSDQQLVTTLVVNYVFSLPTIHHDHSYHAHVTELTVPMINYKLLRFF